jgi:hypothetical protein
MYLDILSQYLDKESVNNIRKLVESKIKEDNLDRDKTYSVIEDKLTDTDLTSIKNFKKWIGVVINNLFIERHHEMIVSHKLIDPLPLFLKLEQKGYPKDGVNQFYLELVINHMVNEFPIEPLDIGKLCDQIMAYIDEKGLEKTYTNFVDLFLKSKLVKSTNVPNELKAKAIKLDQEWNDMVKELDEMAPREMTVEEALEYQGDDSDVR